MNYQSLINPEFTLFPHQIEGVDFILKHKQILLNDDMGVSKTLQALLVVVSTNKKALIVVPSYLRQNWRLEVEKFFEGVTVEVFKTSNIPESDAQIAIIGYPQLGHAQKLLKGRDIAVYDECFLEGTLVDTPSGPVPIQELKVGSKIYNCTGVDTVTNIHNVGEKTETVRLIVGGKEICCTPEHLFFTCRGWVSAKNLIVQEEVLAYETTMQILQRTACEEIESDFLFQELRYELENGSTWGKRENIQTVQENTLPTVLCRMLQSFLQPSWKVLWQKLFSKVEDETTRDYRKTTISRSGREEGSKAKGKETPRRFKENERKQSYAPERNSGEAVSFIEENRTQTSNTRGKWKGNDTSPRVALFSSILPSCGMGSRAYPEANTSWVFNARWLPLTLQNRYCKQTRNDSNRGGRADTQQPYSEGEGQEKNRNLRGYRVESISIQKQRSFGGLRHSNFYDLTIKNHPSYSVEGVLVHNCHMLKSPEAKRTIFAHEMIETWNPEYVIGLSGTVLKNSLQDLYSLLCLISYRDKKSILTDFNFWSFSQKFLNMNQFRMKGRTITKFSGTRNLPLLRTYLKDKYLRRKIDDVLDLPPFINKDILVSYTKKDEELKEAWDLHVEGKKYSPTVKKDSAISKAKFTAEYVKNLVEETSSPCIVFSCHPLVCSIIKDSCKKLKVEVITGKVAADKRSEIVARFQAGKIDILCGTIGAMNTGFTLTLARHMVFNDLDFVPSENAQARGRIRRPGQTRRVCYHYIAGSKIDKLINKNLLKKEEDIKQVNM